MCEELPVCGYVWMWVWVCMHMYVCVPVWPGEPGVQQKTMEPRTQGLTTNLLLSGENTWLECPISFVYWSFFFLFGTMFTAVGRGGGPTEPLRGRPCHHLPNHHSGGWSSGLPPSPLLLIVTCWPLDYRDLYRSCLAFLLFLFVE